MAVPVLPELTGKIQGESDPEKDMQQQRHDRADGLSGPVVELHLADPGGGRINADPVRHRNELSEDR